jgi:hypothetical protein
LELKHIPSGWWYTYPSEKYESQLFTLIPVYGKIKHGPNHQPAIAGHNEWIGKKTNETYLYPFVGHNEWIGVKIDSNET